MELKEGVEATGRIRRPGAGRPRMDVSQPGIKAALEQLVEPMTRGDPTSPLRWTCKSKAKLAAALTKQGWRISATTVGHLLHALGYSLQSARKSTGGTSHPDRNAQFEHINAVATEFLERRQPVISVDTKKKELVGDFKNGGREWQPKATPERVQVHDFPSDSIGKAIPYGVYDMARNEARVNIGSDYDTPAFAVASIRQWWKLMGKRAYRGATDLFITADAGGSNGYRARGWKLGLDPRNYFRRLNFAASKAAASKTSPVSAFLPDETFSFCETSPVSAFLPSEAFSFCGFIGLRPAFK